MNQNLVLAYIDHNILGLPRSYEPQSKDPLTSYLSLTAHLCTFKILKYSEELYLKSLAL